MSVYKFDCTPEQYHAGLDILWDALGNPPADGRLVWQRVADKIASQSAEIERLQELHKAEATVTNKCINENLTMKAEIDRLREGLRELEWCGISPDDSSVYCYVVCPVCDAEQGKAHEADCWLAALLEGKDEKA